MPSPSQQDQVPMCAPQTHPETWCQMPVSQTRRVMGMSCVEAVELWLEMCRMGTLCPPQSAREHLVPLPWKQVGAESGVGSWHRPGGEAAQIHYEQKNEQCRAMPAQGQSRHFKRLRSRRWPWQVGQLLAHGLLPKSLFSSIKSKPRRNSDMMVPYGCDPKALRHLTWSNWQPQAHFISKSVAFRSSSVITWKCFLGALRVFKVLDTHQ